MKWFLPIQLASLLWGKIHWSRRGPPRSLWRDTG
jgi:hypothetical protein